jgi:NAD(P)-dependent dehydrogenase (short-subunit alcohol dehydrogenase family)
MNKKENKGNILITGASTGIGKACALMLDKMGYRVFAGVRTDQAAEELKQSASSSLTTLILDITKQEDIDQAYNIINENYSNNEFSALVNNAGYTEAGPLEFITPNQLRYQIEVNAIGHFSMIQKFLPLIRKCRSRIINVGSPAGFSSSPFIGAYSISKHAQKAMNDSFRHELHSFGIHVIIIFPGFVDTPIWDKSYLEMDRLIDNLSDADRGKYASAIKNGRRFMDIKGRARAISPEKVAKTITRALQDKHPKSTYFVGIDSYIVFGLEKFVPKFLLDRMTARVLEGKF